MEWTQLAINRRQFLKAGAFGAAAMTLPKVVWANGKKILRVRDYGPVESFDPLVRPHLPEENVRHAIYNKLISYTPGDTSEWHLEAARAMTQMDPTHIKFELKKGIEFTNGYGELTAEDVKFSLERHMEPKLKSQLKGDLGSFSHVKILDRYSGLIVLEHPFQPIWMTGLAYMAGSIISQKATLEKGGRFTEPPCSSGPYKFKSWKSKQRTVLEKNELWKGEPADFDEIHVIVIDDEKTAEIAYAAGELDYTRISMSSLGSYISSPQPNSTLITKPDIDKARALLTEAGYGNGFDLTIDLLNKTTFVTTALVIQDSLARVGINLILNLHYSGTFWSLGDTSMGNDWERMQLILNRFSSAPEPYYATQWFTKEQIGIWNWERFNNEEYNSLQKAAAVETDPAKMDKMYQKMMDLMEESGAYTFLTHEAVPSLYRNTIRPALRPDGVPMWRFFKPAA